MLGVGGGGAARLRMQVLVSEPLMLDVKGGVGAEMGGT